MAEGLKLENILNEEQLSVLTDCIKNSLENHLRIERENIEKLTTENAHIKATAERTEFRLGKELLEAESKYKQLSTSAQKLQSQVNELEGKLSKNESELKQANSSNNARLTELQIVKKKNEHLAAEKEDLVAQLDKRRNEADKLNGEIKNLTENLTSANEAKYETLAKIEEIQLHELNLEHRVKRLEQEKELLNEQIVALNEETVQKGQEIISLKREKSTFSLELQSELEQVQDELQITHNRINDLKKLLESKDERIEKLAQQLKDAKQAQIQQEEQYQIELHAQNKLLELYKKSSSDAQARVNELMRAVEEMHKLMNEANETNVQNEQKLNNCNMEWTKQLEEKGKEISQLQKELKDANDLLKTKGFSEEGLEKLFPTAAATSKVLHSGMTLTQIYSEYVKSQEDLQKEKTESHRLSQHLQQIVAEIEEKTPLVNQRFSEYQKALETISCLRNQLANSLTEQEVLQTERNDAKRVSTQLQNENQRLKQQLADVSQQVCVLLKEVEEARGGHISSHKSSQEELVSSSDETTANKVISKHLVTFRDIADLQEKNQQLLAVVRDLSQSQEEKETKAVEEKTCELHLKWEKTKSELQDLQKDKARQAEMLENIIRQRDMYRVLLSQYQGHSSIFTNTSLSPKQLTSTPVISRKDDFGLQETKSALSQLQKEFDVYRKEKIENLQMLNEQLDKLREEVSELRIRNTKLSSQLEYADERFNLLQSNSDMFKRETVSLREKNQKHTASITQHQLVINNLRQEVMSTQEKLSKAEVMAENLRAERDLLKNVEARLLQEKESLMREHQQQNRLVANLQAVQNNLERLESDTQHHLKNQIEKLEKECESLKSKLETEKEQYRSSAKIWEKHVQELQQKVDKEVERAHKTHDELVEAYAHIHELKQEATANAAKLAAAESQLSKMPSPGTGKPRGVLLEIKNLKDQLAEAHNENKTLQDRLNLAQKSVSHYRTLASDLEGQLKEQTQLSTHLKESMEKALKEREEMQVKVDKQSENYEKQCRQLIDENVVLMEESTKKVEIHNQEIDCLREKIQLLEEQAKNAMQNELKAREDCKEQAKLLEEAQEKYERELVLHSQDIQRLGSEKEKIESYHSQIQASEEKHHYLEQIIQEKEKSWEERESILKSELDSITQKYEDVSNTNNIVLNQIELLTSQMAAMQSKDWSSPVSSTESDNKSTQKLFEVIRYLRREKDISSAENEALKSETIRLKIKVDQLEKQSSELQKALSEEQTHAQTIASTEAKHAELLKKVEMLNVLRESNQLLRNEKDTLSQAQTDLENKVQQLEKQMNPMKELNVELSSQVDGLSAENIALRSEVKRWQARTNQLLEQSHKMGPEDYKRMSKENENLCKQVSALNEELHKKQAELSLVNSSVTAARKDLDTIKAEIAKEKSRTEALQKQLDEANNESAEKHKNLLQVKRIARKYKTQYDELLAKYNDLANKKNANESGSASSQETALSQQLRQDMEEKAKQYEEKTKLMSDEVEKMKEAMGKVTKDAEIIKSESMHKEERAKKLMLQARQRFSQLSTQKDLLAKEKDHLLKELEELKSKVALMEQVAEEDSQRTSSLKSHYESKLTMLEKEVNLSKENSEKMEKQIEELTQKINQQRQTSKPSTSAGPVDRLSVAAEPLTANIKPLAPPVQPSVTTLTMRHPPHSHTVTAVARTTPTASIRPIAIGTVSTSCTIASQTRMAAVLPTTAATTSSTPISDEEVRSIASPTSSQLSPALPQATVQPTPTIPTATVTSVVVIGDTPSAAIAPSSHAITSHEPTSTVICMSEPEETVTTQELPPVSTITPSLAPVTALVSPRVEVTDVSDQVEPSDTTASPSVIVSPSGFSSGTNITQTQVVVPTVKRQRDEDLLEHPATSLPQGKRIRMKSEGSQTTQQLTTEIQESGPSSINIAVVVSQPVTVESTVIEKPETPLASDLPPEQEKDQDHGSTSKLTSIQTETEEVLASTSSTNLKLPVDEEEVIIVESDDEKQKEESYDEQEDGEDFHEGEEMDDDDEEGDDEPQTDEYEDDNQMQEENYTQDDDDDDVMSAGPFEVEADMSQQTSDEVEIVVLDDGDDNQMDAQETTQVSNITTPANLAASEIVPPVANVGMPVSTETLAIPSIPPRTALLPRIPGRSERLPSMVRHQQLSFTIGAQGSGYEEGGDSIVPSTPTLFVPHRVDGFAEAVSSPHVPYDRFVFNSAADTSSSQQPLSQLATQGSLGVDDTRMDLSQFDDGSGRSVPTTPLQVSPPDITVTETPDSGSMDQQPIAVSPSTSSEPSAPTVIPMITITQESIDIPKQEQTEVSSEADSSVAQTVDDNAEIETDKKLVKVEQTESRFISQQTESQGPIIVEVTGASGEETSNESAVTGAIAEPSTFDMEQISGESEKGEASTSNNQAAQSRKPIIWDDPSGVDCAPRPSSPQQFSVPTSYPALRSQQQQQQQQQQLQQPPQSPSSPLRASRGRRIRLRGASTFSASRGPGNWGGRRGRGGLGRGAHMF